MISKQKVFLVHGYNTTPNGAWFPWLMAEIKRLAVFAVSLDMPTPVAPVRDEWVAEIARSVDRHAGSEVYIVAHSLGVAATLDYLQSPGAKPVKGAVLVSGRVHPSGRLATAGFYQNFEYDTIREMAKNFVIVHARDDDMVPYSDGVELSSKLGVPLVTLETGGHLTGSQGIFELPPALEALHQLGLHSERKENRV